MYASRWQLRAVPTQRLSRCRVILGQRQTPLHSAPQKTRPSVVLRVVAAMCPSRRTSKKVANAAQPKVMKEKPTAAVQFALAHSVMATRAIARTQNAYRRRAAGRLSMSPYFRKVKIASLCTPSGLFLYLNRSAETSCVHWLLPSAMCFANSSPCPQLPAC